MQAGRKRLYPLNGVEGICTVQELCVELARRLDFVQGHIEIHFHQGQPKEITRVDKSLKFDR